MRDDLRTGPISVREQQDEVLAAPAGRNIAFPRAAAKIGQLLNDTVTELTAIGDVDLTQLVNPDQNHGELSAGLLCRLYFGLSNGQEMAAGYEPCKGISGARQILMRLQWFPTPDVDHLSGSVRDMRLVSRSQRWRSRIGSRVII
jgi:hypothetical protein